MSEQEFHCPNGHVVSPGQEFCPVCGARVSWPQAANVAPAEEAPKKKKKGLLVIALVLLGLCVIVAIISQLGGEEAGTGTTAGSGTTSEEASVRPTRTPKPTKAPTATATPKVISELDFNVVRQNATDMTEAQWKAYVEEIEGLRVEWSGWLEDADESGGRGRLMIDMDSPDDLLSVQDCYLYVPKETILEYSKDQRITWRGDIKSVSNILTVLGITFDDVEIISVE